MVTASHLPSNRNGLKFCTEKGGLEKKDISDILQRAAQAAVDAGMDAVPEPYGDVGFVMGACLQVDPALVTSVCCVCCVCWYGNV